MAEQIEFELIFALPAGEHSAYALSDAVFESGFEDALVGTGMAGLLGVGLDAEGDDPEATIVKAARALLRSLPEGTRLHEVRPDLVSLADVAARLEVKRQALQQREMPLPVSGGLYRIDDVYAALEEATKPMKGRRKARFDLGKARKWFLAGRAARRLNAKLSLREIDPVTMSRVPGENDDRERVA